MSEPLTEADLAAIEARAEAASGPWQAYSFDVGPSSGWAGDKAQIAGLPQGYADRSPTFSKADAAFIAAARRDVPALLAEVRRLRAQLDAIHQHVIDTVVRRQQEGDG